MNKDYPIHSLDDIFNDPDVQQLLVKKQLSRSRFTIPMLKILKRSLNGSSNTMGKNQKKLMI